MSEQVVQLKRSDKNYIAGLKTVRRKLNEEARELNWLDRNLELLRCGNYGALRKLWETTDIR